MLAKLTAKNQLTLPKAVTDLAECHFDYFEVEIRRNPVTGDAS